MTIERKQLQQKPEKKKVDKVDTRKLKRSFKTDSLSDAIVEGKFVGEIGCEIVVSRFRNGKDTLSVCTVKQVDEKDLIHTWDETLQQWFVFPINESPKITKLLTIKK
jgi:hypothetical protein